MTVTETETVTDATETATVIVIETGAIVTATVTLAGGIEIGTGTGTEIATGETAAILAGIETEITDATETETTSEMTENASEPRTRAVQARASQKMLEENRNGIRPLRPQRVLLYFTTHTTYSHLRIHTIYLCYISESFFVFGLP